MNLENKPNRIWNLDETSFCLDPSKTKCVGARGVAYIWTTFGSSRENTSVLMACSAAGDKEPSLIIYKSKLNILFCQ